MVQMLKHSCESFSDLSNLPKTPLECPLIRKKFVLTGTHKRTTTCFQNLHHSIQLEDLQFHRVRGPVSALESY